MSTPGAPPAPPMPPPMYTMPMQMPRPQSALPIAGGALLLVAGILGMIMWAWFMAIGTAFIGIPLVGTTASSIFLICGAIGIIFSLLPLLGGIMAIRRKMWGLGIAGGILGLFSIGFFIGSILSLVGLILIAVSRHEFS